MFCRTVQPPSLGLTSHHVRKAPPKMHPPSLSRGGQEIIRARDPPWISSGVHVLTIEVSRQDHVLVTDREVCALLMHPTFFLRQWEPSIPQTCVRNSSNSSLHSFRRIPFFPELHHWLFAVCEKFEKLKREKLWRMPFFFFVLFFFSKTKVRALQ